MDDLGVLKVTVECYGNKYVFETSGEADIEAWVELMKKILFCVGFHNDNIEEVFGEENVQGQADQEADEGD